MTTINGVDFDKVVSDALAAARTAANDEGVWNSLKDILQNVSDSITADVELIAKKKLTGEFNEKDAHAFMEDQKMVARIRIRSVAIVGLTLGEKIWNGIAGVFRTAAKTALGGWTIF